jgi:hypothetical protein
MLEGEMFLESLNMMMDTVHTSETSAKLYQIIRCNFYVEFIPLRLS